MSTDARINAQCPRCGSVELLAEHMWVVLVDPAEHSYYGFRCPRCATTSVHQAELETLALLARLVPVETLDVPAEARERHTGPALTVDDLIDLMVALQTSGGVEGLQVPAGAAKPS